MKNCLRAVTAAVLAAAPLVAQHGVAGLANPYNTPADVAAGERIYKAHCALCHAIDGSGGRGADLTRGVYRRGSSDEDLFKTISDGIPGTEMPGIFFDGRQMWRIVAYVRSLAEGKAAEQASGDPAKGREIFVGQGGCTFCHRVDGEGARTGPDLSEIGARRSLGHLEAAVLRPGEKVLPKHWRVRALGKDGKTVTGVRLNEDTYSVQLLDASERLVSLVKADLAEYEVVKESAMPPFEGVFSPEEFDDLIAYLASLGRQGAAP